LNVAGSQQAIGKMAKDTSGSDGGHYFNYLPDLFGVKVDNDGVEIVASAARWVTAISNYEREEHNPHATHRGDRTTLKTVKSYIDNLPHAELTVGADRSFAGDRIKGWAIRFKPKG
jgi:hypothetical protein